MRFVDLYPLSMFAMALFAFPFPNPPISCPISIFPPSLSFAPSRTPSNMPNRTPTVQPTSSQIPTLQPSLQPSSTPSAQPSSNPGSTPSCQPSSRPTNQPSPQPSSKPTCQPSMKPSNQPSSVPSIRPSRQPTLQPSSKPSQQPSVQPTGLPSLQPSDQPSVQPSSRPSTQPSSQPSSVPSRLPLSTPSAQPSRVPSMQPSAQPTRIPTRQPSSQPSIQPSTHPSIQPTSVPSCPPFAKPSTRPSTLPSLQPTAVPSRQPSAQPSSNPTKPSAVPTDHVRLSKRPSQTSTVTPTVTPSTSQPSFAPTVKLVVASEVSQVIPIVSQPSSTSQSPSATTIALPAVSVPQASNSVGQTSLSLSIPSSITQGNGSAALSVQLKVVEYDASVWSQRVVGQDSGFNSSSSKNGTLVAVSEPVLQSNILTVDAVVSSGDSAVAYRPTFIANLSQLSSNNGLSASAYNNAPVTFAHTCVAGAVETILFDCPGNVTQFNLTCFGTAPVQIVRSCPVLRLSCNLVSLANFRITDRTYCEVAETTRLYTICSCGDAVVSSSSSSSSSRRRRLQSSSSSSSNSSAATGGSTATSTVSVGVMSQYVAADVGSTVSLSGSLGNSQQVVSDSVLLLSTFGSVWSVIGLIAASLLWMAYRRKLFDKETPPPQDAARLAAAVKAESAPLSTLDQGRDYLRHTIPSIFESSHSLLRRLGMQLVAHHPVLRLFGILTGNQRKEHSPFLILGEILTEFMFVAFTLALLFDLQYPSDDGTCVLYTTEATCTFRKSPTDISHSYCLWSAEPARLYSLPVGLFLQQSISIQPSGLRSTSVQSFEPLTLPPETQRYDCIYNTAPPSFIAQMIVYFFASAVAQVMEVPIRFLFEITVRPTEAEAAARVAVASMAVEAKPASAVRSTNNYMARRGNVRSLSVMPMNAALALPVETRNARPTAENNHNHSQSQSNSAAHPRKPKKEEESWQLSRPSDQLLALRRAVLEHLDDQRTAIKDYSSSYDQCLLRLLHELLLNNELLSSAASKDDNKELAIRIIWHAARANLEHSFQHRPRDSNSKSVVTMLRGSSLLLHQRLAAAVAANNRRKRVANPRDNVSPNSTSMHGVISPDKMEGILQWLQTKLEEDESSLVSILRAASQAEAGLTLMHIFICDLLGRTTNRPASALFRQVIEREFNILESVKASVKLWQRCLAFLALLAVNVFAMYYILLRGLKQGKAWQKTFLLVLMGQWTSDMLFVRVIEIAVVDCFLPLTIAKEMRYVWVLLDELWQRRLTSNQNRSASPLLSSLKVKSSAIVSSNHIDGVNNAPLVDLTKYLLLSRRCAVSFSHLFESQLILTLQTTLPVGLVDCSLLSPLYHHKQQQQSAQPSRESKLAALKQQFLGTVLRAPYSVQSGAVGTLSSLALTGLLLLWTFASKAAWSIFLLIFLPTLAIMTAMRKLSRVYSDSESSSIVPRDESNADPQDENSELEAGISSGKAAHAASSLSSSFAFTSSSDAVEEKDSLTSSGDFTLSHLSSTGEQQGGGGEDHGSSFGSSSSRSVIDNAAFAMLLDGSLNFSSDNGDYYVAIDNETHQGSISNSSDSESSLHGKVESLLCIASAFLDEERLNNKNPRYHEHLRTSRRPSLSISVNSSDYHNPEMNHYNGGSTKEEISESSSWPEERVASKNRTNSEDSASSLYQLNSDDDQSGAINAEVSMVSASLDIGSGNSNYSQPSLDSDEGHREDQKGAVEDIYSLDETIEPALYHPENFN